MSNIWELWACNLFEKIIGNLYYVLDSTASHVLICWQPDIGLHQTAILSTCGNMERGHGIQ